MDDQKTAITVALWAAWCGLVAAVAYGGEGAGPVSFGFCALATIAMAAVARRPIVALAPPLLSLPLGLIAMGFSEGEGLAVFAEWLGYFGLIGFLLAGLTVEQARRRRPAEFHVPLRLDRAR